METTGAYLSVLKKLPGVAPAAGRRTFKTKLKWTALILFLYFIMTQITVLGVDQTKVQQFMLYQILLGSKFGSIMTLGIGPIVTASIIIQLLVGSKIINWNLQTPEGKIKFQGTQKLAAIALSLIEAVIFVTMGTVTPSSPDLLWLVIAQLALGGILVIFMDEVISKWGFGSGVSLFIVAGVAIGIVQGMFNPFANCVTDEAGAGCLTFGLMLKGGMPSIGIPTATSPPVGLIPLFISMLGSNIVQAFLTLLPVIATVLVFLLVIYINAIKVEIPLAFGSVRGFGRRWPLKFLYTSNIPVILTAALLANVRLIAFSLSKQGMTFLGTFDANGQATGGLSYFLTPSNSQGLMGLVIFIGFFFLLGVILAHFTKIKTWKASLVMAVLGGAAWFAVVYSTGLTGLATIEAIDIARLFSYAAFMVVGSVIFSIFWTMTSGMDAHSVATQIHSTGMQIPGFRRDIRIIESVLERYIPSLTVLGGIAVGFLAAFADFTNAIGTGTGILLSTMIVYQLYEEIATQHMEDMNPALRRFMEKH